MNQFTCQMCGAQFDTKNGLETHTKEMHKKSKDQNEEYAMVCMKCGFKASSAEEMTQHTTTTMGDAKHKMS